MEIKKEFQDSCSQHHAESKEPNRTLTRADMAAKFRVHVETIKRWEREGKLLPTRFGPRTVRYPLSYVQFIERNGFQN